MMNILIFSGLFTILVFAVMFYRLISQRNESNNKFD